MLLYHVIQCWYGYHFSSRINFLMTIQSCFFVILIFGGILRVETDQSNKNCAPITSHYRRCLCYYETFFAHVCKLSKVYSICTFPPDKVRQACKTRKFMCDMTDELCSNTRETVSEIYDSCQGGCSFEFIAGKLRDFCSFHNSICWFRKLVQLEAILPISANIANYAQMLIRSLCNVFKLSPGPFGIFWHFLHRYGVKWCTPSILIKLFV